MCYKARATYRQYVFHCDHKDVVSNQPIPVAQDALDGFQQQVSPKEQEIEAGHQVAHAKDADTGRPSDEDDGEHEPEEVAEDDHLGHVQVRPGQWNQETTQTAARPSQDVLVEEGNAFSHPPPHSAWRHRPDGALWSPAGPWAVLAQLVMDGAVLCENAVCTFIIIKLGPKFPQAATFSA